MPEYMPRGIVTFPDHAHARMVAKLAKDGVEIARNMTADEADLWHMATGVSGEAGELLDAVKKHVIYKSPLDVENVIEELGDLEFYMQGVRHRLGITREQTLLHNMDKLSARYVHFEYTDQRAQDRADKA